MPGMQDRSLSNSLFINIQVFDLHRWTEADGQVTKPRGHVCLVVTWNLPLMGDPE